MPSGGRFFSFTELTALAEYQCSIAKNAIKGELGKSPIKKSSTKALAAAIKEKVNSVEEFRFIREQAKILGIKDVYAFGGTASAFAHYVNWEMKMSAGDSRYQKDRFDYDYTNIFRSNQDLDIVIDGSEEQAKQLEALLAEKFPHFQGSKTAWEVRLLREGMGNKESLLHNPNFLNQHTDSNSTGMINLMDRKDVIKDIRDWESVESNFIRDIAEGKLHLYFSSLHNTTTRAKEGLNPPIIFAIRALTKAVQYELELRPEDWQILRKVIREFDPSSVEKMPPYVGTWLEKNSKKLIQNAVNIEYAWKLIDDLGLRNKLIAIKGDAFSEGSMAWWLSREPLRSKKLGSKHQGITALEYFKEKGYPIDDQRLVLAHETNSFLAYESITRAHTGEANVLSSRNGAIGELAAYGDGFYTKVGRLGARGTGLTIRFELNPDAILGVDFETKNEIIIIKNKNAIRVIPESLNLSLPQFFELIARDKEISKNDLALFEKMRRRLLNKAGLLTAEEMEAIVKIILENSAADETAEKMMQIWLELPDTVREKYDNKLIKDLMAKGRLIFWFANYEGKNQAILGNPEISSNRKELEQLSAKLLKSRKSLFAAVSAEIEIIFKMENASKQDLLAEYFSNLLVFLLEVESHKPSKIFDLELVAKYVEEKHPYSELFAFGNRLQTIATKILDSNSNLNKVGKSDGAIRLLLQMSKKMSRKGYTFLDVEMSKKIANSLANTKNTSFSPELQLELFDLFTQNNTESLLFENWDNLKSMFSSDESKLQIFQERIINSSIAPPADSHFSNRAFSLINLVRSMSDEARKKVDNIVFNCIPDVERVMKQTPMHGATQGRFVLHMASSEWNDLAPKSHAWAKKMRDSPIVQEILSYDPECQLHFKRFGEEKYFK